MTIVGTHRGAVSGKTHVHLLRESAAERAAKAAANRQAESAGNHAQALPAEVLNASTGSHGRAG